jgi:TP901 family phage tail tape measure protein
MAGSGALSFNIVWDSAIKGSGFMQASFKGIHTYAKAVEKIKLFKGVSFPTLNNQLHTTVNHLSRMHQSAKKFRREMEASAFDASPLKTTINDVKKDMTSIANSANRYNQSMTHASKAPRTTRPTSRVRGYVSGKVKNTAVFAGGMATGALMGAVAQVSPIRKSMVFESSMADVKKATNANDKQIVMLKRNILKIVSSPKGSLLTPSEIAQIQAGGGRSGVKIPDLPQFTKDIAQASVAMDLDTSEVGRDFAKMSERMDIPIRKISILTNAFTHLENNGSNSARDLINTTSRLSGVFRGLKFKPQNAAAISNFMNTLEVSPELAATSFKILTNRFKKTDDKFGFYSRLQKKGAGELKSIIKEITASMSNKEMIKTFGSQGANVISNMGSKLDALDKSLATVADKKMMVAVASEYAVKMATSEARETAVKNKITAEAILLGDQLKGTYISFLETIPKAIAWTRKFYTENKELIHTYGGIALKVGGAMVAIKALSWLASPFIGLVKGAGSFIGWIAKSKTATRVLGFGARFAGRAVLWLGRAFLLNPIGLAISAIAYGAYKIYQNWGQIKPFFSRMWTGIKGYFAKGKAFLAKVWAWSPLGMIVKNWSGITSYFSKLVAKIKAPFASFFNWIAKKFAWIGSMVGTVKKWTSGVWDGAKNLFGGSDKASKNSHSLKEREANIPKALKPYRPQSQFYDKAPTIKGRPTSLKDALSQPHASLKPVNNTTYASVSTLKSPTYYKPNTTFNDVTTRHETTLASVGGNNHSKSVKVDVGAINVHVKTTDGKFDNDQFVAQVEKAMKEINYDKENRSYEDIA